MVNIVENYTDDGAMHEWLMYQTMWPYVYTTYRRMQMPSWAQTKQMNNIITRPELSFPQLKLCKLCLAQDVTNKIEAMTTAKFG